MATADETKQNGVAKEAEKPIDKESVAKHVEKVLADAGVATKPGIGFRMEDLIAKARKLILDGKRHLPNVWQKMSEKQQALEIERSHTDTITIIDSVVLLEQSKGKAYVEVRIPKCAIDFDDGWTTITIKVRNEEAKKLMLNERAGRPYLLQPYDLASFLGTAPTEKPDVIGPLRVPVPPTTGPGAPSDEKAVAQLGRGTGQEMPGDIGPTVPASTT